MKKIFATDSTNTIALITRVALGVVIFAHGAQKLFGWFGGYGFDDTMGFLTGTIGLPYLIAMLVILIEFFGALFLITGFATRIAAFAVIVNFIGVVSTSHLNFFMNWSSEANKGEGYEYFIFLFALAIVSLVAGGGSASVDALIAPSINSNQTVTGKLSVQGNRN